MMAEENTFDSVLNAIKEQAEYRTGLHFLSWLRLFTVQEPHSLLADRNPYSSKPQAQPIQL